MISGIWVPTVTFFKEKGGLDYENNQAHWERLIQAGIQGLVLAGSIGEFTAMSPNERMDLTALAHELVATRIPFMVNVGSTTAGDSIALANHAEGFGATAAMLPAPYFWPQTSDELYTFFATVLAETQIPFFLYNYPATTGQLLDMPLIEKLLNRFDSRILGIKDTMDSHAHHRELVLTIKRKFPHFAVLSGWDELLLPTLALGGNGVMSALANVVPQLLLEEYGAYKRGELGQTIRVHRTICHLSQMFDVGHPTPVLKEVRHLLGQGGRSISRSPLTPLSAQQIERLTLLLEETGLLHSTNLPHEIV